MLSKLRRVTRELEQTLGRAPSTAELASALSELPATAVTPKKVRELIEVSQSIVTLEAPIGDEGGRLTDVLMDERSVSPEEVTGRQLIAEQTLRVLETLPDRERQVLTLRFGIDDGRERTLSEVGREIGVTRERVRQIELKAMRMLRHPSRSRQLREHVAA
jgi:RNA polymerase primary sigma factor